MPSRYLSQSTFLRRVHTFLIFYLLIEVLEINYLPLYSYHIIGSDAATGLSSSSPVATFDRALSLIRTYNSSSPRSIVFRGGYYFVPTGVTLNATDSGLIISNYPGEQVTLSGGHWISSSAFSSVKDPSLLARLPAAARSSVVVVSLPDAAKVTNYGSYSKRNSGQDGALHLYYKTKPMTIARWPNAPGYAKIGDVAGLSFNYSADTRPDSWDESNEVWMVGFFCRYATFKT